jgi:hypothetical protein
MPSKHIHVQVFDAQMVCGRVRRGWVAEDDDAAFPVQWYKYLFDGRGITTFLVSRRQLEVREGSSEIFDLEIWRATGYIHKPSCSLYSSAERTALVGQLTAAVT